LTVLIDSWAWIEYFGGTRDGERAGPHIEDGADAIVSAVNVAEIYRWFLRKRGRDDADRALRFVRSRCDIVPLTEPLAVEAARIRHEHGWGLGDSIVYATARAKKAELVTGDPDFRDVPGVRFIGPRA